MLFNIFFLSNILFMWVYLVKIIITELQNSVSVNNIAHGTCAHVRIIMDFSEFFRL